VERNHPQSKSPTWEAEHIMVRTIPYMKLFFNHAYDPVKHEAQIVAVDVSDPTKQPTIAWIYASESASEMLCSGDGRLY